VLQSAVERVNDALHELDSPMQAGNQNSTAGYLLSVIEKASATATEFAISFNNYILDGPNGDHAEVIKTANIFSGSIADILINAKGITRLANTPEKADNLVNAARESAVQAIRFFTSVQSSRLEKTPVDQRPDAVIQSNMEVQEALQRLTKLTDAFGPKNKLDLANGDIGELVDREMRNAAQAIAQATAKLTELRSRPADPRFSSVDLQVHQSILAAAIAITNAIAQLIQAATDTQQEIVAQGRGSNTRAQFYKRNNRWTEGIISAAKAVAVATNILIDTADGVIGGRNSPEQLIVASNEVAAATAQLVAASRVKASFMSKTQERLESASKAVTNAVRALVRQVEAIVAKRLRGEEDIDYSKLSSREFKVEQVLSSETVVLISRCKRKLRSLSWSRICRNRGDGWGSCGRWLIRRSRRHQSWRSFSLVYH
jgi:huntingtin-interacting protein 1-related protein